MPKNSLLPIQEGGKYTDHTVTKIIQTPNSRLLTWFIDVGDMVTRLHKEFKNFLQINLFYLERKPKNSSFTYTGGWKIYEPHY
jgi:hypothetical protein